MHITPPVTDEGYDGLHHPRFAECDRLIAFGTPRSILQINLDRKIGRVFPNEGDGLPSVMDHRCIKPPFCQSMACIILTFVRDKTALLEFILLTSVYMFLPFTSILGSKLCRELLFRSNSL